MTQGIRGRGEQDDLLDGAAEALYREREAVTEAVCDLLASSEEAALRGRPDDAWRLMCQAERAAFSGGALALVRLVWRHAPAGLRNFQ